MSPLLPPDWDVPSIFVKRLGDRVGRQRAMTADGHLLLVLHEPPSPGVPERTGRFFWRDATGDWRGKPFGEGLQALQRHVREFAERVETLESDWQAATSADAYFTLLRAIAPLHRTTRNLYTTLQEARELVPHDRDLLNLRDRVGEIERALDLLHGDAKNGLDYTIAHQAEQQAERTYEMAVSSYRLNLLAAVFLPLATLGAVFGMNLKHGLEGWYQPEYFWMLLAGGLVGGVLLAQQLARKPTPLTKPATNAKTKRR